jgi:hypothetical protein
VGRRVSAPCGVASPAKIGPRRRKREGEERRRLRGLIRERVWSSLEWGEGEAAAVGGSDGRDGTARVCCGFGASASDTDLLLQGLQPAGRSLHRWKRWMRDVNCDVLSVAAIVIWRRHGRNVSGQDSSEILTNPNTYMLEPLLSLRCVLVSPETKRI